MNGQATFDVKQFLDDHFGGVVPLIEQYPLWPATTVHKWRQRSSLPGPDLATLLGIIEARDGVPVSVKKYVLGEACQSLNLKQKPGTTGLTPSVFD